MAIPFHVGTEAENLPQITPSPRYALIVREIPLGSGKPIRRTRILGARLSGFTAGDALHLLEVVRDLHAWRLSRGPLSYSVTAAMVPL